MPENIEYMAKCAADSFMQSLMMRNPAITENEELYIQKYMEIYNKSLSIAQKMQKQSETNFEAFGVQESVSNLFK